jgi:hypothetical protein
MSGIQHNHDPTNATPPRKFKPGSGKFYTEEYKDWFAFQTKDIREWKAYVAFCRKNQVDPQNSSYWRRQRYPEIFKGPRSRAESAKKQAPNNKKQSLSKKGKGELKLLVEQERAKVAELEKKLADSDVGEAIQLAEELEQILTEERKKHSKDCTSLEEKLAKAKLQINELLEAAAKDDTKSLRAHKEKYLSLNKEHTSLQKKHNALVKTCREHEDKVKHHNDVLAALSSLQREKKELDEDLAKIRASLADDTLFEKKDEEIQCLRAQTEEDAEALSRKQQVLDLLKEENETLRKDVEALREEDKRITALLVAEKEKVAPSIDDITVATIFWAGALSTGVMPDPIDAAPEIRRLIEKLNAGDV